MVGNSEPSFIPDISFMCTGANNKKKTKNQPGSSVKSDHLPPPPFFKKNLLRKPKWHSLDWILMPLFFGKRTENEKHPGANIMRSARFINILVNVNSLKIISKDLR